MFFLFCLSIQTPGKLKHLLCNALRESKHALHWCSKQKNQQLIISLERFAPRQFVFFYDHLSSRFSFNYFAGDQIAWEAIIFLSYHIKLAFKQSNIYHISLFTPEKEITQSIEHLTVVLSTPLSLLPLCLYLNKSKVFPFVVDHPHGIPL